MKKYLAITASALVFTCPVTAGAQEQQKPQRTVAASDPNDIVVTATRHDETILQAPLSITALNQEGLDKKGVRNIEDLTRMTPGVALNQGTFGIKYLVIRGLTSSVGATMNGVYIDDTPVQVRSVSLLTNFYPAMFDLERVEVLRGPQGTLFGAGAMGGAIRFISAKPSVDEYSGYARGEIGFTKGGAPSYEVGAAAGGPLVQDKVGFRVSGYYRRDGGYIDRVPFYPDNGTARKNNNRRDTYVGQAALTFKPTEDVTITPSIFFQKANRDNSDQFWEWRPGVDRPAFPKFTSGEGIDSYGNDRAIIYSVKTEADFGTATLYANTAFTDRKVNSRDDGTAFYLDLFGGPPLDIPPDGGIYRTLLGLDFRNYIDLTATQRSFTQELRIQSNPGIGRVSYVAGLFYQNSRQTSEEFDRSVDPAGISSPLFPFIPADVNHPGLIGYQLDKQRDRQFAIFGQIDYKLTDTVTVTAGLRYSYVTFDFDNIINLTDPILAGGRTAERPITPKFGVEYTPNDDLMFYGTVSKGFRPGGSNPGFNVSDDACQAEIESLGFSSVPREYKSDTTWAYEVGAKGRVDGRATFAVDVFQVDWTDVQRSRTLLACSSGFLDNLGKARARGVEGKITLTPAKGLSLDAGFSYTDAKVGQTLIRPETFVPTTGETVPEGTIVTKGDRFAPPWIISLAADYETPLGGGDTEAYGHLQWDHRSGMNNPTHNINFIPLYRRSFTKNYVTARLGVRTGGADISLFIDNLLNSNDEVSRLVLGGGERLLRGTYRPRMIGATASYRF